MRNQFIYTWIICWKFPSIIWWAIIIILVWCCFLRSGTSFFPIPNSRDRNRNNKTSPSSCSKRAYNIWTQSPLAIVFLHSPLSFFHVPAIRIPISFGSSLKHSWYCVSYYFPQHSVGYCTCCGNSRHRIFYLCDPWSVYYRLNSF